MPSKYDDSLRAKVGLTVTHMNDGYDLYGRRCARS